MLHRAGQAEYNMPSITSIRRILVSHLRRLLLIGLIVISSTGCDQVTKAAATYYLAEGRQVSFLGDVFRLQLIENNGAFLGLGSAMPAQARFWVLVVLTGIAVAAMLVFVLTNRSLQPSFAAGLSLIIGGGIGNLIDRLINNGAVIDFMNAGIGSLRTGIFNVADVAIMIGIGALIGNRRLYTRS
jgi:signal peptidase II